MSELTPRQRRRALDEANRMAKAAATLDARSKSAIYVAVKTIRECHGFSIEQKRDLVIRSLKLGCSTYDDLVNETTFSREDVVEIINGLVTADLVEVRTLKRGFGQGRPTKYITLR